MKKIIFICLVIFIFSIIVVPTSFGKCTPADSKKALKEVGGFKVKGFFIGMCKEDVKAVLKQRCGGISIEEGTPNLNALGILLNFDDQFERNLGMGMLNKGDPHISLACFKSDEEPYIVMIRKKTNKIECIFFNWKSTFNVEAMTFENFVKKFIDGYKIPEMDGRRYYNDVREKWITFYTYTSPKGYKIILEDTGWLKILKTTKADKTKFD